MTPKEKAIELVEKFTESIWNSGCTVNKPAVKQCALIAVDEIINEPAYADSGSTYWQEVKQEIENL